MLTAGVDLAAQPIKTGAVVVDWSTDPPSIVQARKKITNDEILALCEVVDREHGRVGIDCPLGWPRAFVAFVAAHAQDTLEPPTEPGTESLRLRATDLAVRQRLGLNPLSVSTNMLGVTALRAAGLLAHLRERGLSVDRTDRGTVCEVYPAASRSSSGLAPKERDLDGLLGVLPLAITTTDRRQLADEDVFDALVATVTARAVAVGATEPIPPELMDLAIEEGWIHLPLPGHTVRRLNDGR
jgi:predicted nuclease with RNAse H fold